MKYIFLLPLLLIGNRSTAQERSLFDQLSHVNAEWKKQPDADKALRQQPAILLNERELVRTHLLYTEQLLRSRDNHLLPEALKKRRSDALDVLHNYTVAGIFPKNKTFNGRRPIFIDDENNYCAVGYLMKVTGADGMAKAIHHSQNYNYLSDIRHEKLNDWVAHSGFTEDELALIQPGYANQWPSCIVEMHYNNIGPDINEYIEVHMTNGQLGGMAAFDSLYFFNNAGVLYKKVSKNQMLNFGNPGDSYYHYSFPANEDFADEGEVKLIFGTYTIFYPDINFVYYQPTDTLESLKYNASGITTKEKANNYVIRSWSVTEDNTTAVGSSLSFIGAWSQSSWVPVIQLSSPGAVNPGLLLVTNKLNSFGYTLSGNDVVLHWKAENENDLSYYELEKSLDGINFMPVSKQFPQNGNGIRTYSYTDRSAKFLNYYRVKEVSNTGKAAYSKLVTVKLTDKIPFEIMPNPVINNLHLSLEDASLKYSNIVIYDINGRAVNRSVATAASNNIDVSRLRPGKYLVSLITTVGTKYTQQFIKQ